MLWNFSTDEAVQEYKLTTDTYGTSSAPYLATRCLRKLADDTEHCFPRAAHVLKNYFYMMTY
jgi:hypothetical protein